MKHSLEFDETEYKQEKYELILDDWWKTPSLVADSYDIMEYLTLERLKDEEIAEMNEYIDKYILIGDFNE